jgi:hypothetical protein
MGYQPQQALFAQQATALPFVLQGDASFNPAAATGAQVGMAESIQQQLAQQGVALPLEEIVARMPQEATVAIAQEQAQTTTNLKAELEAELPRRRNWLQTAAEVVLPTAVGFAVGALTSFAPGVNVALGVAASTATAALLNTAVQKGALSNQGFDWNRKVDGLELLTTTALSALPLGGIGNGAGKLALNTVGKKVTNEIGRAAIQYGAQGAYRGAIIGGGVEFTRQAANGEQINLGRIGASAFTGGVFGGVSGGALGAAGTRYTLHKGTTLPQYGTFKEASTTVSGGLNATGNAAKGVAMAPVKAVQGAYNRVTGRGTTPTSTPASGTGTTPVTGTGTTPTPATATGTGTTPVTGTQLELDLSPQPYTVNTSAPPSGLVTTPTPTSAPASTAAVAPPPSATPNKAWWDFLGWFTGK